MPPLYTSRPYTAADLPAILHLLVAYRVADPAQLMRYPTVWRLELLLTSRLWQPERDARLWFDGLDGFDGLEGQARPVAFAALWSRQSDADYRALEWVVSPDADPALGDVLFTWALARVSALAKERGQSLHLGIGACSGEDERIARIERYGFARRGSGNVYMARLLANLPADVSAPLPDGYAIRQLTGDADAEEVMAYQALYEQVFAPVALTHRRDLLRSPDYLHFVAMAPDGELVAFCELSFSRAEWAAYPAWRVGWVDYVGTLPAQQRKGLGRALLLAGLRALQALGADTALLITMEANASAQSVYTALGFAINEHDISYIRDLP